MKQKLAIILSVIALVGVIFLAVLWIIGDLKLSIVTLDTFIGVSVTMLAILFTIVIGWQIINAIKIREEIKSLEIKHNRIIENEQRLAENDKLHTKETYNLHSSICQLTADSSFKQRSYVEAFAFTVFSLYFAIMGDTPNQSNYISQMQLTLTLINSSPLPSAVDLIKQIEIYSDKIRQTDSYRKCLSCIYDKTMTEFWQKMRSLGWERGTIDKKM